eukprot:scaffold3132_cov175-Prasinococcus_capsulatus_cf.AAC.1
MSAATAIIMAVAAAGGRKALETCKDPNPVETDPPQGVLRILGGYIGGRQGFTKESLTMVKRGRGGPPMVEIS